MNLYTFDDIDEYESRSNSNIEEDSLDIDVENIIDEVLNKSSDVNDINSDELTLPEDDRIDLVNYIKNKIMANLDLWRKLYERQ